MCDGRGRLEKGMGALEKNNTCGLCKGKGYIWVRK